MVAGLLATSVKDVTSREDIRIYLQEVRRQEVIAIEIIKMANISLYSLISKTT